MPKLLTPRIRLTAPEPNPSESGYALVELAIVLPVFFAMIFGFINFCMVMFGLCNITYACRQADRYACLHSSTSLLPATQATTDAQVAPFVFKFPTNTYTDTLTYTGSGNVVGGTATVTIKITYTLLLPFIQIPTIKLTTTASGTIIQ